MLNSLIYGDCAVIDNPENRVDQFRMNDLVFRSDFCVAQYEALPRLKYDLETIALEYPALVANLHTAVFIDMVDIFSYASRVNARENSHGIDKLDIQTLISLVTDGIGEETSLHENIWNHFTDDLENSIATKLGLEEGDVLLSDAFDKAMEDLFAIASIVASYIVNTSMPLVNEACAYTYYQENNGIVAFKLRTLEEIHALFN